MLTATPQNGVGALHIEGRVLVRNAYQEGVVEQFGPRYLAIGNYK